MKKTGKKKVLFLSKAGAESSWLEKSLKRGFTIHTCHVKRDALRSLNEYPPDICIVDLHIPRIDPFKLLTDLRDMHPMVGLVALYRKDQNEIAERALRCGVDACVSVPISEGEFRLLITKVLNKASARGQVSGEGKKSTERDELLRYIVDNSPVAIIATDGEGNISFYSKGSIPIFGYTLREILGKPISRLLAKGDEEMHRILKILAEKGRLRAYGVDFLRKDGKRIIGILSGSRVRVQRRKLLQHVLIMKEITGSIKLEQEIYESKIELESVFDSIVDPLAVIRRDFTISRANRATARLVGVGIKEVVGKKCHELLHRTGVRCKPCPVSITYRTGQSSFAEIESRELDEIFHVYSYPIFDYKGALKSVIEHRSIVTEQKRLERERHRLELELMEKHKLSSVGMLAQGIAHNLNTPLGVIMGRSELLRDDMNKAMEKAGSLIKERGDEDEVRMEIENFREQSDHTFEIILKQVENMSSIIKNLMDIGRQRQDSERKKLNINHILEQELRFLEADMFFKHEATKVVELDPGIPYIEGVYSDFSQSFTNIIRNAMDAMHGQPVKELRVRTYHDGDLIYVEIHDTGEGIKKEHIPKIFDPFFTTKDFGEAVGKPAGVGLGLHSCYQLLSSYGVKFDVKSKPGDTTFTIKIPIQRRKR
ncbi:MAG: PAS domain S-box protein [Candidatus Glassbacteria bacterium]